MEHDKIAELINDLAAINLGRAKAYEEASFQNELYDVELRTMFALLANQSRQNMYMLNQQLEKRMGKNAAFRPVQHGDLYGEWEDNGDLFSGASQRTMLASCEEGELAMIALYEKAVQQPARIETRELLQDQLRGFGHALATIRRMLELTSNKSNKRGVI